ncbi:MAG: hypothetical protein HY762_08830 [Planctomycetes bacterium]|nr:hypothetical protein [Planctomycetota bacterium]
MKTLKYGSRVRLHLSLSARDILNIRGDPLLKYHTSADNEEWLYWSPPHAKELYFFHADRLVNYTKQEVLL